MSHTENPPLFQDRQTFFQQTRLVNGDVLATILKSQRYSDFE